MFVGSLQYPHTYTPILTNPVWDTVFAWIQQQDLENLADGDITIDGKDIFASVQTIQTIPAAEGIFEAHRKYIDVHYCITGSERIAWAPVQTLAPTQEFDTEKDYGLYAAPEHLSSILLTPQKFAIFLPEDAHMPKIQSETDKATKKVVIKVFTDLLYKHEE